MTTLEETADLFDALLSVHVKDGKVDYEGFAADAQFSEWLAKTASLDPAKLDAREKKLAFWINAYNGLTIREIADFYCGGGRRRTSVASKLIAKKMESDAPAVSIKRIPGVWTEIRQPAAGGLYSLGEIENKILRKGLREPRIHFAIVCASVGCPKLAGGAYRPEIVDAQLDEAARAFFNDPARVSFDASTSVATINPIMKWYRKDFGEDERSLLEYALQFREDAAALRPASRWRVAFSNYDWSLNALSPLANGAVD